MSARRSPPRSPPGSTSFLLYRALAVRGYFELDRDLASHIVRLALAAALMAAALFFGEPLVEPLLAGDFELRVGGLALLVGGGVIVYAAAVFVTRAYTLEGAAGGAQAQTRQGTGKTDARRFRHPADRQSPSRQLSRRDPALGEDAGRGGMLLIFLADLHAITVHNDPAELRANVHDMAAALIACGIDPDKAVLFNQARVPAHAEMAWLLNCTARMGWLNRMTQFKEKSGKNREGVSVGLFDYPVLQAADVLLYQATHVPVGEDQKQHLELIRDIAPKFNTDYGVDLFTLPEPHIGETAARIMSLRDGSAKMSKSDPSDMSRINLADDSDAIAQKIRKAKTDPEPLPDTVDGAGRPPRGAEPRHHLRRADRPHRAIGGRANTPARASARSSRRWPTCWSRRSRRSAPG